LCAPGVDLGHEKHRNGIGDGEKALTTTKSNQEKKAKRLSDLAYENMEPL
jgi:hypothetical protein